MDELLYEFEQVSQDWDAACQQTVEDLNSILTLLKNEGGSGIASKAGLTLNLWKNLHVTVSKVAKNLEKRLKQDSPSPGDIEDGGDLEHVRRTEQLIKTCLLHSFYRKGDFEAASRLEEESKLHVDLNLRETYAELNRLLDALRDGDISASLSWIDRNQETLGESACINLRFQLNQFQFMRLLKLSPIKAFLFAQTSFRPFTEIFSEEVQTLMGCLAYAYRLDTSPYATFVGMDFLSKTSSSMSAAFAKAKRLPQENALYDTIRLGSVALPKINKIMSLMKERKGIEWSQQGELPVEIELDACHRHHSVFVCPVLKQQTTDDNPPMMLTCGHVICLEALNRLGKGNNFVRFKCPYCPMESSQAQAIRVYF